MKRVLVTGAGGFIGRQSLRKLVDEDYEVHAVHANSMPLLDLPTTIQWHRANLLARNSIPALLEKVRPTHLLHFGWYAEPGKYLESQRNADWVRASIQLMSEFAVHGGQRFVAAGTCFEYDGRYGYCQEELTPLSPASLYGHCKSALRSIFQAQAANLDIQFAWGRIFFLYGPHEHPNRLVSSVIRSLIRGEEAKCSPGTQIRDFMHVEDVAAGFNALLSSDVSAAVNICTGQAVTIRDVVSSVAEQMDSSHLLELGALPMRANEPELLVGNSTRLNKEVGFTPKYSLESGLADAIEWWRSQSDH